MTTYIPWTLVPKNCLYLEKYIDDEFESKPSDKSYQVSFDVSMHRICLKQDLTIEQLRRDIEGLTRTTAATDSFRWTEEQLVHIAIEENISITEAVRHELFQNDFRLTDSQILALIAEVNMTNTPSTTSLSSAEGGQRRCALRPEQFLQLCSQQNINLNEAFREQSVSSSARNKFIFIPSQMAVLINANHCNIEHLLTLEQTLRKQPETAQQLRLNPSQLAYLFGIRRSFHQQAVSGLSAGQVLALYTWHQSFPLRDSSAAFSLTREQIEQMAIMQNLSREHLQTLTVSTQPLQLSRQQLIQISMENGVTPEEIHSSRHAQKSTMLTLEQLCNLMHQNDLSAARENPPDSIRHTSQHAYLHLNQILSLAHRSSIPFDQLARCSVDSDTASSFRLIPDQLASVWIANHASWKELDRLTSWPSVPSQFTLTDEQFSSLLHSASRAPASSTSTLDTNMTRPSIPPFNPALDSTTITAGTQHQVPSTLVDPFAAIRDRLQSSVQAHAETVKRVSNSIIKRDQIENTLNVIRALSQHSIGNTAAEEVETIPAFVLDLLKVEPMTKNTYESIKSDSQLPNTADNEAQKAIAEGIQKNQLNLSQIQKIQSQLLTPDLTQQFQSGQLSRRILDAYKGQPPIRIVQSVQSSMTQLHVPASSPVDDHAIATEQSSQLAPITIPVESPTDRARVLRDLGSHLDAQLIALKNEYGVEPTKGEPSVRQLTSQLRQFPVAKNIEHWIGRSMDEADVLNILDGHASDVFQREAIDLRRKNELFERNIQQRLERVNERVQLIHLWQQHLEQNRLKRQLSPEEHTALVCEDVSKFEELTGVRLTEDDLRIVSMNRFAALERVMSRPLTGVEYHHLLETDSPSEYIEQELLHRPLTADERTEQEELTWQPYQDLFPDATGNIRQALRQQKIIASGEQLEQVLRRRAELVDHYDLLHAMAPSIKLIEEQLDRSLTLAEKKRLAHDDYTVIEQLKDAHVESRERAAQMQADLGRSLTEQEIRMIANGQFTEVEKLIDRSPTEENTKFLYNNRILALAEELSRDLTETEARAILDGEFSSLEQALGRPLTPAERDDLASRSTIGSTRPSRASARTERTSRAATPSTPFHRDDSEQPPTPSMRFALADIERAIGRPLAPEELRRFAQLRSDLELSNLLDSESSTMTSSMRDMLALNENLHSVDTAVIERILNRPLTIDELTQLAGDRFDETAAILQRPLHRQELIDLLSGNFQHTTTDDLDRQKEEELKELPIDRLRHFETILGRPLSSEELLRFARDRFTSLLPLLTDNLTAEQIRDLAAGRYDAVPVFQKHLFTAAIRRDLQKDLLRAHIKHNNLLEEMEYLTQRKLSEQELRALLGDQCHEIEAELGHALTEEQLRNILSGRVDPAMNGAEELFTRLKQRYDDDYRRTRLLVVRSLMQLESETSGAPTSGRISSVDDLLTSGSLSPSSARKSEPTKAFDRIARLVEQIAEREHVEEFAAVNAAIDKFHEASSPAHRRSSGNQAMLSSLSSAYPDSTSTLSPSFSPSDSSPIRVQPRSLPTYPDEDVHPGWSMFKNVDYPRPGVYEERPLAIKVKHRAQTYVIGIPEEYADAQAKASALKIYESDSILAQSSHSSIMQSMTRLISQLSHLPMISDATHFVVPSRAYDDIIEAAVTYEAEITNIEADELQRRDSPETVEWYEECIQRNIQIHAQIPTGYQPSIVYCHTGRRSVITPAKRDAHRKASLFDQTESRDQQNDVSAFGTQSIEPSSTTETVTDLIMQTIASSQKTDLLEAFEELFSQDNLDKYQMTETHWQDIFLILLNSYLHSDSPDRKDIFKRLTDKLHELRRNQRRRSSDPYPSISVASPITMPSANSLDELEASAVKRTKFHFGLRSSFDSIQSGRSQNDSEISSISPTPGQQSVTSRETLPPLSNNASACRLPPTAPSSITSVRLSPIKGTLSSLSQMIEDTSTNTNAHTERHRRYKITVVHSDQLSCFPANSSETIVKPLKLPPIDSKTKSTDRNTDEKTNRKRIYLTRLRHSHK